MALDTSSFFANTPHLMGIVNVTSDSFYDGGAYATTDKAIEHGIKLAQDGAVILDVGGESTRPGAAPVDPDEEIRRVVPVIKGLAGVTPWLSIDTRNAKTMKAALSAGANIVNDISALTHDRRSIDVIKQSGALVSLMHMKGTPQTMQTAPDYGNVVHDVYAYIKERIEVCEAHGINRNCIIIDPGIGFGKTTEHNLSLVGNISKFHELACPLLLGASRKSFIGKLGNNALPQHRLGGSLAVALWACDRGVQILRVHDVQETKQALLINNFLIKAGRADTEQLSGDCPCQT
ncbi:MAG: dihydropteroate synthase [Proteobacteria bacterium]|nr:dihydropteroate synthase [Pseudomonadota bacterium]